MERDGIKLVGIASLVLEEYMLRKIDKAVNFSRLSEIVEPM